MQYGYCKICGEKVILKNSKCTKCQSKDVTKYVKTSHCKNCDKMTLFFYDGHCNHLAHIIFSMLFFPWIFVWAICIYKNEHLYRCSQCGHTKRL